MSSVQNPEPRLIARTQVAEPSTSASDARARQLADARVPATPLRIDRYAVLRKIGAGAMGSVYVAYDPKLRRELALKLLHTGRNDLEGSARIKREAQAMAQLNHRNVVAVYDVGTVGDAVFVAMEYVEGTTLGGWLKRPRGWREIVEVFVAAGRGLQAAHEAGLVHRDFKPTNVLVSSTGEVKVSDFGLAKFTEARAREPATSGAPAGALGDVVARPASVGAVKGGAETVACAPGSERGGARVEPTTRDGREERGVEVTDSFENMANAAGLPGLSDSALTMDGALLGTPAYMAPEQLTGAYADARSDQFAFCVSLFEALHGGRPFSGLTVYELLASVTGEAALPLRNRAVPAWLNELLGRGLRPEADDRWPTMAALLDALERDSARRRLRWAALGVVAALAVAGGGLAYGLARAPGEQVCSGAESKLATAWSAAARDRAGAGFRATGLPYAADAWARTSALLDAYASEWIVAHIDACEATALREEQSPEVRDARMACLDERLRALAALVEVFEEPGAEQIKRSVVAANRLPPIASCADLNFLHARVRPPDSAELAARVEAQREALARVKELGRTGSYELALTRARALEEDVRRVDYPPLQAEFALEIGQRYKESAKPEDAARHLEDAYFTAQRARHAEVAIQAAILLTGVVGRDLVRPESGLLWSRLAALELERQGGELDDREHRASLHSSLGSLEADRGAFDEAIAHHRAALELREALFGHQHPQVAATLNNLGNALDKRGSKDAALQRHQEALAIWRATLGPDHPHVSTSLGNLGNAAAALGRFDEALRYHREAVVLAERNLGRGHADVGTAYNNLGEALTNLHEYAEAEVSYQRALSIWREAYGPEHHYVAVAHNNLGEVYRAQDRLEEALASYRLAAELLERTLGPEHHYLGEAQSNIGHTLVELGRLDEAEASFRASIDILERAFGPEHIKTAHGHVGLGLVYQARAQPERAVASLERALALFESGETTPYRVASVRFRLAENLVAAGRERARALELARAAEAAYVDAGEAYAESLLEVRTWLRAQGDPTRR